MGNRYIPVLYCTFTERNGIPHDVLSSKVDRFCVSLCFKSKSHLKIMRGAEYGLNLHEHAIIAVAEEELVQFWKRVAPLMDENFKTIWNGSYLNIEKFDMLRFKQCFDYVLVKHDPLEPYTLCPKHRRSCRKGLCEVNSTVRRLAGSATALL